MRRGKGGGQDRLLPIWEVVTAWLMFLPLIYIHCLPPILEQNITVGLPTCIYNHEPGLSKKAQLFYIKTINLQSLPVTMS